MKKIIREYGIGGSTPVKSFDLGQGQTIIAVESVSHLGKIIYRHNPQGQPGNQEFLDSLERSLEENASIWEMLAKH